MENVKYQAENGTLSLYLSGNVDSGNAGKIESEINDIRAEHPEKKIVVDCDELKYISSAGLRVILRLRKAVPDTSLVNVCSEVYDIFDMTGFTEMMDIRKAYRKFSVEGCEVIGQGANGKVCRIDEDTIVKVYENPDALPEIQRERELARTAFVLGVPTAIPYDVVRIEGGGYGSVFELLNASTLAQLLKRGEMSVDEVVKTSVDLLKLIHGTLVKPDSMPDMKKVALGWASFLEPHIPEDYYQKLYSLVLAVPDDLHMMHGDYHIKNVMIQNGEALLIDMDTLCYGNPIFELASVYNAYLGFSELDHTNVGRFLGIDYDTAEAIWNKSLRLYLDGADEETAKAVEEKAKVIGYTRLIRRRIRRKGLESEEGLREINHYKAELLALLDRVDSLVF